MTTDRHRAQGARKPAPAKAHRHGIAGKSALRICPDDLSLGLFVSEK
jgi:hypothetical protein